MDAEKRFELLEQIGKQLQDMRNVNPYIGIGDLEVVFIDTDGEEAEFGVGLAIASLAGDVYIFESFDLRDAHSAEVRVI